MFIGIPVFKVGELKQWTPINHQIINIDNITIWAALCLFKSASIELSKSLRIRDLLVVFCQLCRFLVIYFFSYVMKGRVVG